MTPRSVALGYQDFRGLCCLHLQGEVTHIFPIVSHFTLKMVAVWNCERLASNHNTTLRHNPRELESSPVWKPQISLTAHILKNSVWKWELHQIIKFITPYHSLNLFNANE